jgi:hypothetical protein
VQDSRGFVAMIGFVPRPAWRLGRDLLHGRVEDHVRAADRVPTGTHTPLKRGFAVSSTVGSSAPEGGGARARSEA